MKTVLCGCLIVLTAGIIETSSLIGQVDESRDEQEGGDAPLDHSEWLANVLREMQTVKPGMTREDLYKVFEAEGGLYTRTQQTYVYRDCHLIKVDVTFEAVGPPDEIFFVSGKDVIRKISRPHLGWMIID